MSYQFSASADHATFAKDAASWIAERVRNAIAADGLCILGLSGGSTPQPVYAAVAKADGIDWNKVHVFLVDERCVHATDKDSNQRMIRGTFDVAAHLHFPDTNLPLEDCLLAYAKDWKTLCAERLPHLIVLGMGPDGHTASLFPPVTDDLLDDTQLLAHTKAPDGFAVRDRITFTINPLAAADEALLLIEGDEKKKVFDAMIASDEDEHRWPLKRIIETSKLTTLWSPG